LPPSVLHALDAWEASEDRLCVAAGLTDLRLTLQRLGPVDDGFGLGDRRRCPIRAEVEIEMPRGSIPRDPNAGIRLRLINRPLAVRRRMRGFLAAVREVDPKSDIGWRKAI
jgi:hypothetical protein